MGAIVWPPLAHRFDALYTISLTPGMADPAIELERSYDRSSYAPADAVNRPKTDVPSDGPDTSRAGDPLPTDLVSLIKLAAQQQEVGNDEEAERMLRRSLDISNRKAGPEQPEVMLLLTDLTRLYLKKSEFAAAEPLLLRLLEIKRAKGEDHPEVATVLASLANVRRALGCHESAEQLWRRVLEIRERTLAPNHFAIATALEHLGDACAARGKIQEALNAFKRAVSIRELTLGINHSSLRVSHERIADLQLQASEETLDAETPADVVVRPARHRLTSGESPALTAGLVSKPASQPPPRKRPVVIEPPFVDRSTAPERVPRTDTSARQTGSAHIDASAFVPPASSEPLAYLDVLESIQQELDEPSAAGSLQRIAALVRSAAAVARRKQVMFTVFVIAALVLLFVAANSGAFERKQQTPAFASIAPEKPTLNPPAKATNAVARTEQKPATDSVTAAKVARSRSEEKPLGNRTQLEKKPETKGVAIPTLSSAVFSRLDSVASKAGAVSTPAIDPAIAERPNPLTARRSTLDDSDPTSAPQRARLIGELPTPRVPNQVADVEGEVRVRFNVDPEGRPVLATFAVVNSPNPLLTAAVRKVIPSMRFEPARSGGPDAKPVADVVELAFQFARRE